MLSARRSVNAEHHERTANERADGNAGWDSWTHLESTLYLTDGVAGGDTGIRGYIDMFARCGVRSVRAFDAFLSPPLTAAGGMT
jgi:hypothetical protein